MSGRVVVVEDELAVRALVARTLTDRGYRVAAFETLGEASALVRRGEFELLVVDVELRDGCGLDLIGMLPRGTHVPSIVMSALDSERDFTRAFAAGAADCMVKPFPPAELLARCALHTSRASAHRSASSRPDATKDPLVFGRYRIERQLGSGTYGRVFLARDSGRHEQRVALKVLTPPRGEESEAKLRFIHETLALARVNDPGVVRVLDIGESPVQVHFAMEYVEGKTLLEHVAESGPLSEAETLTLARGLLRALAAIVTAGLVHRDLKPSNVMLRKNDARQPVLIDFGLSLNVRDRHITQAGISLGTPAFMAPEVIRGKTADHRSDLFALGLVLRFALTGRDAFEGSSVHEVMALVVRGPIPLPEIPLTESFAMFLEWLLETDPSSRPPTALAALRAIDAIDASPRTSRPSYEVALAAAPRAGAAG